MKTAETIRAELRASGHDELANLPDEALISYERVRLALGLPETSRKNASPTQVREA